MYRFALRPRWILSHLFVLALVVVMVSLGFWQLRRLDERRDRNAVVSSRLSQPIAPVDDVIAPADGPGAGAAVAYRRVTVQGTYLADEQVLVRGRSLAGAPGSWVMAPLRRSDGSIVVVNRGWIPNSGTLRAVPEELPTPTGPVTVRGLLQETQTRGDFGATDPPTGDLATLARVDVGRLARQLDGDVVPAWVQLTEQDPRPGRSDPRVLPPPELDEGPHLSYAGQWFTFSLIALVGYPLILRRNARERAAEGDRDGADTHDDQPDPHDVVLPGDPRLDPIAGDRPGP